MGKFSRAFMFLFSAYCLARSGLDIYHGKHVFTAPTYSPYKAIVRKTDPEWFWETIAIQTAVGLVGLIVAIPEFPSIFRRKKRGHGSHPLEDQISEIEVLLAYRRSREALERLNSLLLKYPNDNNLTLLKQKISNAHAGPAEATPSRKFPRYRISNLQFNYTNFYNLKLIYRFYYEFVAVFALALSAYPTWRLSLWLADILNVPLYAPARDQGNGMLWLVLFLMAGSINFLVICLLVLIVLCKYYGWSRKQAIDYFIRCENLPAHWMKEPKKFTYQ